MSTARLLQLGSVVRAELADANGIRKVRRVVVLTANLPLRRFAGGSRY